MTETVTYPESRAITATVLIDAPASSVWNASIEPAKIRRWWSCESMPMTVCEVDFREGGSYRFVGREANGTEHAFHGEYREIVPNRKIVHRETYEPFPDATALVTITFDEEEGKTRLVSRIVFPTDEAFQGAAGSGMVEGMAMAIDRLAELAANRDLSITRLVDVPRERLYAAWTDPALLMKWFVPRPYSLVACEVDLRPGGVFATTMKSPEGEEYPGTGVFLEIVPNERIVFTDALAPGWKPNPDPLMVAIVTFEEEDGRTRYTAVARHWSVATRERHEAMGFHQGWNQALDQLVELTQADSLR